MRRLLGITTLACVPAVALAYNLDGNRWPEGSATFNVNIPGTSPSGTTWSSAFEDALAQWTEKTEFNFLMNTFPADPCAGFSASEDETGFPDGNGDGLNGAAFTDDVCGNAYGKSVLALTLTIAQPGTLGFSYIDQTDIVFNNAFNWDIYSGPRREAVDFRRVALHELGHALGLGHESGTTAMMAPSIGDLDTLQVDDIAGANALYGGPGDCAIQDVAINGVIENSLQEGDCAVLELYGGGDDTSYVDTYRLHLVEETALSIVMESSAMDSVLLITDEKLNGVDFDDDSAGNCDALIHGTFPAGEYLILANTYVEPFKCPGNTGGYKLSISDNALPILTRARTVSGGESRSIFHGGATADKGLSYKTSFLSSELIDVDASIQPDPEHLGRSATFYVVAVLSSGQQFAKRADGKFVRVSSPTALPAYSHTTNLQSQESFSLLKNLNGDALGAKGISASLFIGYSLDNDPGEIYFNGRPITFSIQ